MSRHHTFPRCTREAPYMGRYRPTHALIATTDRILTVFSWQTGCVPVHASARQCVIQGPHPRARPPRSLTRVQTTDLEV